MARIFSAPAKINLTLEVLARRSDGYHGVRTVMVPLELCDEIAIAPAARFAFACDVADLQCDENLVMRALRALGQLPPVRVELRKRIPVAAGLGGGSSDAAAIVRAAMDGEFGSIAVSDWIELAASLGSDVPFFLSGTGALVEGIGERVTPLGALPRWHVLIVKPPVGVSTARAYSEIDRAPRQPRPRNVSSSLAMLEAVQRGSFDEVTGLLHNDFQNSIAQSAPEIARTLQALEAAGATHPLLSGSGSCVFTLAEEAAQVEAITRRLDLPPNYERYTTAFAPTPAWRA